MTTPVRSALLGSSPLLPLVQDGLGAVAKPHRRLIHDSIHTDFLDSLDVDEGLRVGRETENRWDYLLGHAKGVVGLEPHSANTSELSVVKRKRTAASQQLRTHLKPGVQIQRWYWVASGPVAIVDFTKAKLQLAQAGVTFVGKQLLKKHIDAIG
ncbi:MAG: hypothetical protein U0234_03150 [Sandaracinus sp.]